MTNPVWMAGMAPIKAKPERPFTRKRNLRAAGAGLLLALTGLVPSLLPLHSTWAQSSGTASEEITVEGGAEIQRIAVPYYRTSLTTVSYARDLMSRIDHAALTVCGDSNGLSGEMRRAIERSDCRRDAVMRAVRDVNNVNLDQAANRYGLPE